MDANKPTVYGLEVQPLPAHWTPVEAVIIVRALDEEGVTQLSLRMTDGLATWDSAGLLRAGQVITDGILARAFRLSDEDDDGP